MTKIHKKFESFMNSLNENISSELESETILHILNLKIQDELNKIENRRKPEYGKHGVDKAGFEGGTLHGKEQAYNKILKIIKDFENDKQNESLNESQHTNDYKEYFRNKMEEFGVDSPKEMTPEQWEEVNRGWTSEDEGNYHTFFRNKMEEFGVDSPKEMTSEQWEEINNMWKSNEGNSHYDNTSWTVDINGEEKTITIKEIQDYLKDEPIVEIPLEEISDMGIHKDKNDEKTIKRSQKSNLDFPIIIAKHYGKYTMILDGHHRLKKADDNNIESIKSKILDLDKAPEIYKKIFKKN